jgi:hypothetical protein
MKILEPRLCNCVKLLIVEELDASLCNWVHLADAVLDARLCNRIKKLRDAVLEPELFNQIKLPEAVQRYSRNISDEHDLKLQMLVIFEAANAN